MIKNEVASKRKIKYIQRNDEGIPRTEGESESDGEEDSVDYKPIIDGLKKEKEEAQKAVDDYLE